MLTQSETETFHSIYHNTMDRDRMSRLWDYFNEVTNTREKDTKLYQEIWAETNEIAVRQGKNLEESNRQIKTLTDQLIKAKDQLEEIKDKVTTAIIDFVQKKLA